MDIGSRLQRVEEKVDENGAGIKENRAGIKENGERLDRLEEKVEKNGERIDHLIEGQEKLQKQSTEHFEFFKVYFARQQEENRRHLEILIEQFQSKLSTQGEGIQANRESTQKAKKTAKKNHEKLMEHEARIRNLEAG
jgi:chromosome segregation ATPase